MVNRFFKYTAVLVIASLCSLKTNAQTITAEAKLQQYTIRIGDQTKLFLSAHQTAKEHLSFPKLAPGDTLTGKVSVVNINKPDTAYDQSNKNNITVTQSYTVTSFDAGTYNIPSFSIGSDKEVIKTNPLALLVQTVKVDTTKGIYDIKQPIAVSYSFMDWLRDNWLWISLPLAVIGIIIGLIVYLRSRPKPQPKVKIKEVTLAPHMIALEKLKTLGEKKLWQQGETKLYYVELSDIIRDYLERRYTIKTHEQTTDEIFSVLKRVEIDHGDRAKLRQLLVLADLVKFAKEKPLPAENEQSMQMAVDFVTATKPAQLTIAGEGGTVNV